MSFDRHGAIRIEAVEDTSIEIGIRLLDIGRSADRTPLTVGIDQ